MAAFIGKVRVLTLLELKMAPITNVIMQLRTWWEKRLQGQFHSCPQAGVGVKDKQKPIESGILLA